MSEPVDFYADYDALKSYAQPGLKAKHVRQFDEAFWVPADCTPACSVLEIGCGTGQFLLYLRHKGVTEFLGIDRDPKLAEFIPPEVRDRFRAVSLEAFLDDGADGRIYDRVALFDVLEHFTPDAGAKLLRRMAAVLTPDGAIVARLPNASSPWGLSYQFGDLTHKAAYTPGSIKQLSLAAGFARASSRAHHSGSPVRRMTDRAVHAVLGKLLEAPPAIWTANFITIIRR